MRKLILNFALILAIFCTSSCITRVEKRGYVFDLSDHHLLKEGVTSKDRVLRIMGSPTIISDLDADETWVYYFENVERILFFYPVTTQRDVLVLRFDKEGVIKELKSLNLEDQDDKLAFISKYTTVKSNEMGFFKSIFSNVGQIKPQ